MNSTEPADVARCAVCRHLDHACPGRAAAEAGTPCHRFERYGEFLAKELAFVDRQFIWHQVLGLGLALGLGLGMTWVIRQLG
ncbi:MAG: hypothetical protein N3C59_02315 [Azovibrio sp.]|nr:hypothetical protein [Azovibrio sp.]